MNNIGEEYLTTVIKRVKYYKDLGEKTFAQLEEKDFHWQPSSESNSIAVIMKHIAGNMFSRWTDFLTSDGEKPDRNRDMEFVIEPDTTRDEIRAYWEKGWQCLFNALEPLPSADFEKQVMIRGEPHTIVQAINRQLMHYAQHIGQIVFLAKHFRSAEWQSLSIPRNRSAAFNKYLAAKPQGETNTAERFDEVGRFAKGSAEKKE